MGCLRLNYDYQGKVVQWEVKSGKKVVQVCISVDPLSDKYPGLTPFAYCANNPLRYIDPDGRDFDPVIDEKNKTITINATYYTSNEDKGRAQEGVDAWNAQSGKYEYTTDKGTYTVNFNLKVEAYGDYNDAKNAFEADKSGQANLFKVGSVIGDNRGMTVGGNDITVSSSSPARTSTHEIGHTLGINDGSTGVMISGDNSNRITRTHVSTILNRAGMQSIGVFWGGGGTWESGKPAQSYNMIGKTKKTKN